MTTLPRNPRQFAALVRSIRTEDTREELRLRICEEFPQYDSINDHGPRPPRGAATAAGKLFESRLLELVRTPLISREFGWDLRVSHEMAWHDLVYLRSAAFARLLRAWMRAADARLAAAAAEHLAWMGLDADRARILSAVSTNQPGRRPPPAWLIREKVASGVHLAAEHHHLGTRFRCDAFDAIARIFTGRDSTLKLNAADEAYGELVKALLALDPVRARHLLMSPEVLRPDSAAVWAVLFWSSSDREDHPGAYKRPIDPAVLWPVYEALRAGRLHVAGGASRNSTHRQREAMGLILTFTAGGDPIRTVRECREILRGKKDGLDILRTNAAAVLKRCRKIPEPAAALQRFWRSPGRFGPAATKVMEAYALVDHFHGDGLEGYFGNLGWRYRAALQGLALVGATAAAKIIKQGAAICEAFGPLRDERSMVKTTAAMDEAAVGRLHKLNDRFDPLTGDLQVAIERYIGRHPREFPA